MFFLIRLGLFLASIAVIGGFALEHFPSLRVKAIELVNPIAHQDSLFAQLNSAFDELNTTTVAIKNSRSPAELKLATSKQEQALVTTKALIQQIQQDGKGNTSLINQGISKIIDSVLGTPIPSATSLQSTILVNTNPSTTSPVPIQTPTDSQSVSTIQQAINLITGSSASPSPAPSPICPPAK